MRHSFWKLNANLIKFNVFKGVIPNQLCRNSQLFWCGKTEKIGMMSLLPQLIIWKEIECEGKCKSRWKCKSRGTFCNNNVTSCRETRWLMFISNRSWVSVFWGFWWADLHRQPNTHPAFCSLHSVGRKRGRWKDSWIQFNRERKSKKV